MVWYVEFDLVWFGCLDLHRLALVYFGLLCFGPWTDKIEKRIKREKKI